MIQLIPSAQRFNYRNDWLNAHWHFSFDQYYDPANTGFGPLRVFNDDVFGPGGGFGLHRHAEMEIITYVISGELAHKDSTGATGRLAADDVQHMSAGRGIRHAEYNPSRETPVHLLQIWIEPSTPELDPAYEQEHITLAPNVLTPIAAGQPLPNALQLHQDATLYVARLAPAPHVPNASRLTYPLAPGRRAYLFLIAGALDLNGQSLSPGDQARITDETTLTLTPTAPSHLLLIDLP